MPISQEMKEAMFTENTDNGLLVCLTISHPVLPRPLRVVNNMEDIVVQTDDRGPLEFIAYPFDIIPFSITPDRITSTQLIIDNVSLEITQALRTITSSPIVLIEIRSMKNNYNLEVTLPNLKLTAVEIDVNKISGSLVADDVQIERWPSLTFNPSDFPGLFQ